MSFEKFIEAFYYLKKNVKSKEQLEKKVCNLAVK